MNADAAERVAIDDEPECEGLERVDRGDVRYKLGSDPSPWSTGVEYARWRPGEVEERVNELIAMFRSRGAPFTWGIGPNTDAPGLASVLVARGLHKEIDALILTATIPIRGRLPDHDLRLVEEHGERTATDAIRIDRAVHDGKTTAVVVADRASTAPILMRKGFREVGSRQVWMAG